VDSTTLAALTAEQGGDVRTVTLGFEEFKGTANDEVPLAEETARRLGSIHQTVWSPGGNSWRNASACLLPWISLRSTA